MTHTITIETQSDNDFALFKGLAQRIGVSFSEKHTSMDTAAQEDALKKFTGSWKGEESGDELVEMIYGARNDRPRDIEL